MVWLCFIPLFHDQWLDSKARSEEVRRVGRVRASSHPKGVGPTFPGLQSENGTVSGPTKILHCLQIAEVLRFLGGEQDARRSAKRPRLFFTKLAVDSTVANGKTKVTVLAQQVRVDP